MTSPARLEVTVRKARANLRRVLALPREGHPVYIVDGRNGRALAKITVPEPDRTRDER